MMAVLAAPKVPDGLLHARADDWNARGGDGDGRVDEGWVVGDAEVVEVSGDAAGVGP